MWESRCHAYWVKSSAMKDAKHCQARPMRPLASCVWRELLSKCGRTPQNRWKHQERRTVVQRTSRMASLRPVSFRNRNLPVPSSNPTKVKNPHHKSLASSYVMTDVGYPPSTLLLAPWHAENTYCYLRGCQGRYGAIWEDSMQFVHLFIVITLSLGLGWGFAARRRQARFLPTNRTRFGHDKLCSR